MSGPNFTRICEELEAERLHYVTHTCRAGHAPVWSGSYPEMKRTQSRGWASICSLLPSRNHWREKKMPCACSRFSLAQFSVSQGIKCGQWNQPHRLVCKFIWKIPAKVPGKHFLLMLQVSFSFLSWNSIIWLWRHFSTRQHDEKSLTRCLCCNVVTTSTVKYLKCVNYNYKLNFYFSFI